MSGRERICDPGCLLSPGDESEDLLRKSYYNAARDGEDTVGALGGVVGLEGEAHLEDAVTQQDEAHGPDEGKMKSDRLVTTDRGSSAAKAGTTAKGRVRTRQANRA